MPQEGPPIQLEAQAEKKQKTEEWKEKVERIIHRQHIEASMEWTQGLSDQLDAIKTHVKKRETQIPPAKVVESLVENEYNIPPEIARLAQTLSEGIREEFPEVKAIVLLGSSVHGGGIMRRALDKREKEQDLDFGVIYDPEFTKGKDWAALLTRGEEITDHANKILGTLPLSEELGLSQFFHCCEEINPERVYADQLTTVEETRELLDPTKLTNPKYAPEASKIESRAALVALLMEPSFPSKISEQNRELILEALGKIHEENPDSAEEIITALLTAHRANHKLKRKKHFPQYRMPPRKRDLELIDKVAQESADIMQKPMEQVLRGAIEPKTTENNQD